MADSAAASAASKQISVTQRLDILNKLEAGASVKDLAREYNVTERSVRRIRQNAPSIRQFAGDSKHLARKRIRTSATNDLDNLLYGWFLQRRLSGERITDNTLVEKAKELHAECGVPTDFTPSRGWLWRFKKSCDLRLVSGGGGGGGGGSGSSVHGESVDTDKRAAEQFVQQLPQMLETNEISDDNLYNMDETSLFWRMLPNKTLIGGATEERVLGGRVKKDRILLGFCTNASGNHKLPLLFVNKHEYPRALKHCKSSLPVTYMYHGNSWMNNAIFQSWYENEFKPRVRGRQLEENRQGKVLLILDNFNGHKSLSQEQRDDGHFKVTFLPPNTSTLIQPMDQGVIAKCKKLFRQRLLQRALQYNGGISEFYADYDIKDCIDMVHESWMNITATNIFNAWNRIFNRETRSIHSVASSLDTATHGVTRETVSDEEVTEWIDRCGRAETIREDDTEEEEEPCRSRSPSPIEEEEVDRLLHYLQKLTVTEPQIANHAISIIDYYNTK